MPPRNREDIDLRKAIDTVGSGGSGSANLIPEVVSAGLRRFVELASPIYDLMPKRDWPTDTYKFRSVTGRASAAFTAEGAVTTESNQTYAKPTTSMKWITSKGSVTGPMLEVARKTGRDVVDVWQEEVDGHADAIVREIERTLVNGNSGTDPLEFDGFKVQITLAHNAGGDPLILSDLDAALDLPASYPSIGIMSRAMRRRINSLLQAQQRFTDRVEVRPGFKVLSYNDVPLLVVDTEADDDLTDTILFPDLNYTVMPMLKDITFEPLAKTDDSEDFFIKMYVTLAVEGAARYHSKVTNIVNP